MKIKKGNFILEYLVVSGVFGEPKNSFELIYSDGIGNKISIPFIEPVTIRKQKRYSSIFYRHKFKRKELEVILDEMIDKYKTTFINNTNNKYGI